MTTLHTLGTLKIAMYARDHEPAHVHLVGVEIEWRFTITDGAVLSAEGRLTSKQLRAVQEWIAANPEMLQAKWAELRKR